MALHSCGNTVRVLPGATGNPVSPWLGGRTSESPEEGIGEIDMSERTMVGEESYLFASEVRECLLSRPVKVVLFIRRENRLLFICQKLECQLMKQCLSPRLVAMAQGPIGSFDTSLFCFLSPKREGKCHRPSSCGIANNCGNQLFPYSAL